MDQVRPLRYHESAEVLKLFGQHPGTARAQLSTREERALAHLRDAKRDFRTSPCIRVCARVVVLAWVDVVRERAWALTLGGYLRC